MSKKITNACLCLFGFMFASIQTLANCPDTNSITKNSSGYYVASNAEGNWASVFNDTTPPTKFNYARAVLKDKSTSVIKDLICAYDNGVVLRSDQQSFIVPPQTNWHLEKSDTNNIICTNSTITECAFQKKP